MGIGNISGFEFLLLIVIYFGLPVVIIGGIAWLILRIARATRGMTAQASELSALRDRVERLESERDRAR